MSWFENWFGADYDEIYQDRNPKQALKQVEFLWPYLELKSEDWIVDLGCGKGRHLQVLSKKWPKTIGFDLSEYLLQQAPRLPRARADFRSLPLQKGSFGFAGSFFTSFGYLDTREDDLAVLKSYVELLRPKGYLFLDIMNSNHVPLHLPPDDTRQIGEKTVSQHRFYDGEHICKEITIELSGKKQNFSERVRLFSRLEITDFLEKQGMELIKIFGDENGNSFDEKSSPRMSVLMRKAR